MTVNIGSEIRRAREAAGMTQEELAAKAKMHRVYLSYVERDEKSPTLRKFVQICGALGIAPSTLMARAERRER